MDEGWRGRGPSVRAGEKAGSNPEPAKGVQKRPAKILHFTAGSLRVRADDEGFSVDEVEGGTGRIFSTYKGRKKNAKAFHKWAKANQDKLSSMTFAQVIRALRRAKINFLKVT